MSLSHPDVLPAETVESGRRKRTSAIMQDVFMPILSIVDFVECDLGMRAIRP